jgi:membrane protease YdiL (CAAX protease family)
MIPLEEERPKGFSVKQGVGIYILLLVAVVIVGGISSVLFGLNPTLILSEAVIFLLPLSFLSAGGYSFRSFLSYPRRLDFSFWILTVAATVCLLGVISDITGYIHQWVPRPKIQQEVLLKLFVAKTWPEYLFRIFAAGAVAGFCEEFAFRGFLQRIFSERLGGMKGFLLTAFLFALMHLDPWNFAGVFLLGLFLGYLVYLTGNLWVAILMHALANSISFTLGFFSPDVGSNFTFTFPPYITLLFVFLFILSLDSIRKAYLRGQPEKAFGR